MCEKIPLAAAGQPCGEVACEGGLFCNDESKVCEPKAKEGEACPGSRPCLSPATCQGDVCELAKAPQCGL